MTQASDPVGPLRHLEFADSDCPSRISSRRVLRSATPWFRPAPRMLLDLSRNPVDMPELAGHQRAAELLVLDRFEDADLVWSDCFLLGSLFQNAYFASRELAGHMMAVRDAGSFAQTTSGMIPHGTGFAIPEARFADKLAIPEHVLFATPHEPHHWGIWLAATMAALAWFVTHRGDYDRLFLYVHHPNMQAMVDMMGIAEHDIIRHAITRSYHFTSLDLLRTRRMQFYIDETQHAFLRDLALRHRNGASARRIFVSRRTRSKDGYRPLVNEAALIAALEALDFTIVEPELLPVRAQMSLFSQAEIVIGLGGGGMFNAVFCKPGTRILDIESTPRFLDAHATLFASLGLAFGMIIGDEDPTDPRPTHRRWYLDLDAAMPAIRRFIDG